MKIAGARWPHRRRAVSVPLSFQIVGSKAFVDLDPVVGLPDLVRVDGLLGAGPVVVQAAFAVIGTAS